MVKAIVYNERKANDQNGWEGLFNSFGSRFLG